MSDALVAVVVAGAKAAINPADSLEDRCRAAMKASYRHSMVTDEDVQFQGAVIAVYLATNNPAEKQRIDDEMRALRDLSALLAGIPVNLDAIRPPDNPIGIRKMWLEITEPEVDR